MNDSLMRYLESQGYVTGALQDRIRNYLTDQITILGGTPSTVIEDMWSEYGKLAGLGSGLTVNEVQMLWAASKGATGTTWNDLMSTLP